MKVVLMHVKAFGGFWMALSIAVSISAETARAGVPSDKLTLGYTTVGAILTPVWIPAEMGIFQKYGLDVDMKLITTGPVVVSALIAGEIGIAAASGEPIVSGILGGADLTIMGFGTTTTPVSLYVIPSITQVEQLKGATVAVSRLTSSGAYILKGTQTSGSGSDQGCHLDPSGRHTRIFRRTARRQGPGGDAFSAHDLQG
jgi:ABC-type nitrate/sulfonate/bicarbonate transport system substrate-binding protein